MQKWIRDRNRRRKKKPADSSEATEQTPPLQPVYPDMTESPESAPQPVEAEPASADAAAETQSTKAPRKKPSRRRKKKPTPETQPALNETANEPSEPGEESANLSEDRSDASVQPLTEVALPLPEPEPQVDAEIVPVIEEEHSVAEPVPLATELTEEPAAATEAQVPQQSTAPAAAAPAAQQTGRRVKGAVVLAVGLPGSGKSTWFRRRGVTPLSSDMVRHLLFDSPTEQRYQDLVFGTLRSLLRARLIARMPMNYVDATNLSPKERRHWIKMAKDFGFEVHAVYFDVPLEVCMERNRKRGRIVPDEVMQRMAAKLKPPTFDEGFSKIIVVRLKHRDGESAGDSRVEAPVQGQGAGSAE